MSAIRDALTLNRIRRVILPNLKYLPQSRVRKCRCCRKLSVFVNFGSDEYTFCMACRANFRYEMLGDYIRRNVGTLSELVVLELDPQSPMRQQLASSRSYIRTYYSPSDPPGSISKNGARCEDLTRLTLASDSVDVMVSSDVLEHVPDLLAAFRETERVLRPGGFHLFTVPPRNKTAQRAMIREGIVVHLIEPEYHRDPLSPNGTILAFWDFGPDAPVVFNSDRLRLDIVDGPQGRDGRVLWRASKSP